MLCALCLSCEEEAHTDAVTEKTDAPVDKEATLGYITSVGWFVASTTILENEKHMESEHFLNRKKKSSHWRISWDSFHPDYLSTIYISPNKEPFQKENNLPTSNHHLFRGYSDYFSFFVFVGWWFRSFWWGLFSTLGLAQTLPFFVARRFPVSARCNFTQLRRGALGWLMDGKGQLMDEFFFPSPFLTFDFHFGVMKWDRFFFGEKKSWCKSMVDFEWFWGILRDFQPSWCISTEGFLSKFPVVGCWAAWHLVTIHLNNRRLYNEVDKVSGSAYFGHHTWKTSFFCRCYMTSTTKRSFSFLEWWKNPTYQGFTPPKSLTWLAGKSSEKNEDVWRCISYWKWAFSNVMLDFQGCNDFVTILRWISFLTSRVLVEATWPFVPVSARFKKRLAIFLGKNRGLQSLAKHVRSWIVGSYVAKKGWRTLEGLDTFWTQMTLVLNGVWAFFWRVQNPKIEDFILGWMASITPILDGNFCEGEMILLNMPGISFWGVGQL